MSEKCKYFDGDGIKFGRCQLIKLQIDQLFTHLNLKHALGGASKPFVTMTLACEILQHLVFVSFKSNLSEDLFC